MVLIDTPDEVNTKIHKTIPFERYKNIQDLIDDCVLSRSEEDHKKAVEIRDSGDCLLMIVGKGKCTLYCFSDIYVKLI